MGIFGRTLVSFVSWTFTTSFADIIVYIVLAYRVLVGFPLRILWCPWGLLRFGLMNSIHFCWLTNPCPLTIDCWLLTDSLCPTLLVAFSKMQNETARIALSIWSIRKVSRSRILLVAIFGTTLDWSSVLDFHSKILQASLILELK